MGIYRTPYLEPDNKISTVHLGGPGADATKFLRGDKTWAVPAPPDIAATKMSTTVNQTIATDYCAVIAARYAILGTASLRLEGTSVLRIH